jgi:non-ribosomal peptide synthetase component E (peptide arylation enzyme)
MYVCDIDNNKYALIVPACNRYLSVYTRPYKGYYFTGDGCRRDADGYYWITGALDDTPKPHPYDDKMLANLCIEKLMTQKNEAYTYASHSATTCSRSHI